MINFLLGVTFVILLYPILDKITQLVGVRMEEYIAKRSVNIAQYNQQISKLSADSAQPDTAQAGAAIGFVFEPQEEVEEDEEIL